jgi:hypothetical protein
MVANQGARRVRACILGVVPGDVVEAAVKQAETTLATRAEVTPERLQSLLEKFSAYGVTKEQIETRIQRRLDAMTPALLVQLGKVYNSLKDGMSTPGDWFEMPERPTAPSASASDALKDKLRGKKPAAKASTDPETGEIKDERTGDAPTAEAPTMADVMRLISETDYDGAQDLANTIGGNAPTEAANAIAKHKKGNK